MNFLDDGARLPPMAECGEQGGLGVREGVILSNSSKKGDGLTRAYQFYSISQSWLPLTITRRALKIPNTSLELFNQSLWG